MLVVRIRTFLLAQKVIVFGMNYDSLKKQIWSAQRAKLFHSRALTWKETFRVQRMEKTALLKECVKEIANKHIEDNMKAPNRNAAKPALLSKPSFNIYFGDNLDKPSISEVVRSGYATGSGQGTIGLDPRFKTLRHIFPKLSRLRDLMRLQVQRHYEEMGMNVNCEFNHVSVKIYFDGKTTEAHTDISFDDKHRPTPNNSQLPGTPVVIATIGDNKLLQFHEYFRTDSGNVVKGTRKLTFLQKSGSIILLDHRDEELNNHRMFWKHSSKLVDEKTGCCISLMFRVTQARQTVLPRSGRLSNPVMYGTGVKERQFNAGWKKMKEAKYRKWYENEVRKIQAKINAMIKKHCDADISSYIKMVDVADAPRNI